MIRSNYKNKFTFLHILILLSCIALIYQTDFNLLYDIGEYKIDNILKIISFVIGACISLIKLLLIKDISIHNNTITISFPFRFYSYKYNITKKINYKIEVIKPSGSGAGILEFPYKKLTLYIEGKSFAITSKTNLHLNELENYISKYYN